MDYRLQKRLAAEILGVGESRIWISPDPDNEEEISQAITKDDIRGLIERGLIKKIPKKGNSHRWLIRHIKRVKGHRRGYGKREGTKKTRVDEEEVWVNKIRKMRTYLKYLRDKDMIDSQTYRRLYRLSKGNAFKSLSDLKRYIDENKLMKGVKS
ncbi:ribosomal protein L19E [Caldisphaera lagunensis DSM 15908]|uniref:Large ribosomal subunit protein eL19 n=1 Tax=Caldisphaera lagunensis (strain DSM 15908 / JCM 11604 / ANMR 0165 / IC-154) TaxID=1056495 RepID=L0AAI9_CALLD|nr:50S ribosomal protein L19e [Caldisphaera lagunensis]AFZ70896.1 ribosomal protein L19E [Caldisphaera lagunensis DSM 15908]